MDYIANLLNEFSALTVIIRIFAAALMGGLIGFERGRHGRAAGLRTHILICVGAAITALTGIFLNTVSVPVGDVARLSAQVISGIGFLGAGIILVKNGSIITGLTTAAGMWATAAIGVAVGFGFYTGAAVATVVCVLSVTLLSLLEKARKNQVNGYFELSDVSQVGQAVTLLRSFGDALFAYEIVSPKSGKQGNVGIIFMVKNEACYNAACEKISEECSVAFVVELKD